MTKLPFEMTASAFVEQIRRNATSALVMIPQSDVQDFAAKVAGAQLDVATVYAQVYDEMVSKATESLTKFSFASK